MREDENKVWFAIALVLLTVTGCIGAGYFVYVSAGLVIFLAGILFVSLWKEKKYCIAWDWNMLAIAVMTGGYLLTFIWAVDQGMALVGVVKILPVLLWMLFLCNHMNVKEKLIHVLPYIGGLMTLFSLLMMQFPIWEKWVTVAGRLSGFFQYPNTYALFLLVCILVAFEEMRTRKPDVLNLCNIALCVAGIGLSGSRIVYGLFALTMVILLVCTSRLRKVLFLVICTGIAVVALEKSVGNGVILQRIMSISVNESTLLGRFLYWRDAFGMILRHPFGMGYYGYYYLQQEMQTGVYSVVNCHNEFLQMMLDVGILPALAVFANLVRMIVKSKEKNGYRFIVAVILFHSLLDYDFQFIFMWMVLILFLDIHNIKEKNISIPEKAAVTVLGALACIGSLVIGLSDAFYTAGNAEQALKLYGGNMQARIFCLSEAEDAQEMKIQAENILERNRHISVAYSALARAAIAEGDMQAFIKYKLTAIKLAPYQYDEYIDYFDTLIYCADEYLEADDVESAKTCVLRAEQIPELLEEVEIKTSPLGWKIRDYPRVSLSHEDLSKIERYKDLINNR